ncbi:Crotonase/enoyl-CoA hydratase family protein [Rhodovastum atsumiense]|uniref:Crotonase/enoyl-CoA hydratase family protein n=1 Tax=Rhodovastum atsumiense TaxID=504468 RepID=A0A5M6IKR5_9PROT|nr:crotonase/enoyl-CoA hydratase family protein [Rhodovastum atsumiense]KAA5608772.1 crotonase/enoyl-CoA hydratase family protein [Rhodovastum atsumiense]CAH2602878.1 Crotonase/enoyl-CoA hydratase family protein [Rhodovastum atsumiense]
MQLHATEFDLLPSQPKVFGTPPRLPATARLSRQAADIHPIVLNPVPCTSFADYRHLDISIDAANASCWCYMQPEGRPIFSADLLGEILRMQAQLRRLGNVGLRNFIMASRAPGIFNLGGDLAMFAHAIRTGDRAGLRRYGHDCVHAIHENTQAFGGGAVTIALVQGDALGGGFETALAFDIIVAERHASFGFPECLFNLFPGMGAYSYLARRIAPAIAERIILSGRTYTATELHELGVVDLVVDSGRGEQAVRELIERQERRHAAHRAIYATRRRINTVPLQELLDIVEMWVDAALQLGAADLRKMERLVAFQNRRIRQAA